MSAFLNQKTGEYEQYNSLEGDMVAVGKPMEPEFKYEEKPDHLREIQSNCGWCHCNPCECDGFGNMPINQFNYDPERIYDVPGYERPNYTPVERQNMRPRSERPTRPR